MQIDSKELSEFVRAVLTGIDKGVTDENSVAGTVKFQIGLKSTTDKQGNVKLSVVGIGGGGGMSRSTEEVARIEFEVDDIITVGTKKFEEWGKTGIGKAFFEYLAKEASKKEG